MRINLQSKIKNSLILSVSLAPLEKSWSQAFVSTRFFPPREKGPILTVALASNDSQFIVGSSTASPLTNASCLKIASVSGIFFLG